MALKDKLMTLEDFKAVRDVDVASNSAQFTEIKADLNRYQENAFRSPIIYNITSNTWTVGQGINPTTGANMPNTKYARTDYIRFSKPTVLYFDDSNYDFIVWEYSAQSVSNAEFAPRGYYGDESVIISIEQGVTDFRVGVKRKDNADISTADITVLVAKLKTFILTDNTLTLSNVPADAKKTGDEIASIISKTVSTPNAKMLSVGNSILTGSVWVDGSFDHFASYNNSPYGNIANALNISQSNETHMLFGSAGLMYDAGNGSFLDNILETDISEYDYILTNLWITDLNSTVSSSIGSLNSTAGDGTVAGAVLTLLAYIKTNNPDCKLILVGIPPVSVNGGDRGENVFTFGYENGSNIMECDYLMHQLAEQEHFTFVDWEDFEPSYHWKDFTDNLNIHLNNENTYRKVGEYLGNQITAQQEQGTTNRAVTKCCSIAWKSNTYINADGGEGTDRNVKASDFIPVIPGETICVQHVLRISSNLIYLTCYDITKNKIADARDSTGSAGTAIRSIVEYIVPASGAYIRVSALASEDICHVWHARESYMPNPQIGLLGDKISQAQDEIEHLMAFNTNIALNAYNVLYNLTGDNRTHNGVTFTWNESAGTVKLYSESPSTGTAFSNLFYNDAHFPDGIVAGGKYKLLVRGAVNGAIRIGYLTSGGTIDAPSCTEDTILTIPAHATGMYIRASVNSGVTINETISYALLNTATNKELADVAQYGTKDALCGIVVDDSTRDGLTFTFGNGTVTVDGTASATTVLPLIGGATTIPDRLMELSGKVIYVDYQTSTPLILRIYGIKNGVWTKLMETDKVMEYVMPDLSVYDGVQVRFYCYVGSIFDNDVIAMPKIFSSTDYKFLQQRFNYGYKEPMITIIDDDGDVHFKYDLLPLIQELNVPIASAVTTTRIAKSEAAQPGDYYTRWMTWEQIRDCAKGGAEIVCHMYSHPTPEQVEAMSQEEIVHNLYMAKNYLKINGVSSDVLVYSNSTGLASNKLRSVAGRVFDCGFRTGKDATPIYPDTDRYSLPRYGIDYDYDYDLDDMKTIIDMVAANGGWCVWMIHTSASHAAPGHWRAILDNEGNMTGEDDTDGTGNYVGKVKNVPALKSAIQYALQNGVKIVTAEYGLQKYFAETGNLH